MKNRSKSRNQICTGVTTDKKYMVCIIEVDGKPSQKHSYQSFKDHIKPAQTI